MRVCVRVVPYLPAVSRLIEKREHPKVKGYEYELDKLEHTHNNTRKPNAQRASKTQPAADIPTKQIYACMRWLGIYK